MSQITRIRPPFFALVVSGGSVTAQTRGGVPALPPPDRPVVINTDVVPQVCVVPIFSGLSHPWGMAFRSNGDILVTEREGGLRIVRDGKLLERDIPGVPEVFADGDRAGLLDIALHPDDDRVVYLTYTKAIEYEGEPAQTVALARGRLDRDRLTDVHDIFVAKGLDDGIAASRLLFHPDGTPFMSVSGSYVFAQTGHYAQDPGTHFGKLLRLNDDGSSLWNARSDTE
jgi:glucose/arabinose dehydrogenase